MRISKWMRRSGKQARQKSADYAQLSFMRLEERRLLSADARFAIHALDAVKPEGNGYQTPYTFEVVRTGDPHSTARLEYYVTGAGQSPADAADFGGGFPQGELKLSPHEMRKLLVVNVGGDLEPELDESFVVEIFPKWHGHDRIVTSTARGTILNDDFAADLSITKNDCLASAVPGTELTYTVVVSNDGPCDVWGATVRDLFPSQLVNVSYSSTITRGHASGNSSDASGDARKIHDSVYMSVGSEITYTITGTIDPAATGWIQNTATVQLPWGLRDSDLDNNTSTDRTELQPRYDLQIKVSDRLETAVPGQTASVYTIVVANSGPSFVRDASVHNQYSDSLNNVRYTSHVSGTGWSATPSGSGAIDDLVSLGPGSAITYTVTGDISAWAMGSVVHVASVQVLPGDTDPTNNSAIDTTRLIPVTDLSITKTARSENATPGLTRLQYTIVVNNAGPSAAQGAWIIDELPDDLLNVRYTSQVNGDAAGNTISGEGDIDDLVSLAPGSTITYFVTADIVAWASGTLVNTAEVCAPDGTIDTNTANNRATDTTDLTPQVDLQITKSDGRESAVPGLTRLQYTIVVTNAGPSAAQGAWIVDEVPDDLLNVRYTSQVNGDASGNTISGEGDIDDLVSLAPGSTITYFVTADIMAWASETLVNTAEVFAPHGTIDTNTANNRATDATQLTPQLDLQITKTGTPESAVPGLTRLQYAIVVTNAGPSAAQGAWIVDEVPDDLLNVRYTSTVTGDAAGNTISGEGDIDDLVSLAPGSTITYFVTADISPWASETLVNTAEVLAPRGTIDMNTANNRATDTTQLTPQVDLQITKTGTPESAVPGLTRLQYAIVVTNAGPSAAQGVWIVDEVPDDLLNVRYTSTVTGDAAGNTISGEGDIDDLVSLAPGSTITYFVTADISPWASETLVNTAEVFAPHGTIDSNTANNRATDATELTPQVDLQITKSDGRESAVPGLTRLQYTIVVTNAGPSAVRGASLTDNVPDALINVQYVSSSTGSASGNTPVGEGNIFDLLNLGPGDSVQYEITADVRPSATGLLVNTARIRLPQGVVDTELSNNSATDIDVLTPQGDLSVSLADDRSSVLPADTITYTVVVTNTGPSDVQGATLKVVFPAGLADARYTSRVTSGVAAGNSANESGQSRGINDVLDLAAQTTVTYTITGAVAADVSDPLLLQVVLTAPSAFGDLASDNNEAADSNIVTPQISLRTVQTILPEGNAGETLFTFLVERRGDREQPIEVQYSVVGAGVNPANPSDFGSTFPGGVFRLAPGEWSGFITLAVAGDYLL